MINAFKYQKEIREWFYLDSDDITIRRKKDDDLKGKFKKHDIVKPYALKGSKNRNYKGIWIPRVGTTISLPWVLTVLRGIKFNENSVIDHIDGDYTNNSKNNIRVVSQLENSKNRKLRKDSSSGYTGISWHKNRKLYQVRVTINGKRINRSHKTLNGALKIREELINLAYKNGYTPRHFQK